MLYLSVSVILGSFANALAVRFGSRVVVMCGGLFLFTGYIASMFATRIEHLFVTYGILLGEFFNKVFHCIDRCRASNNSIHLPSSLNPPSSVYPSL